MLENTSPKITCYLTDKDGNIISPFDPNAIIYIEISPENRPKKQVRLPSGETVTLDEVTVLIKGYVAFSTNGSNLSKPIPFCTIKQLYLCAPEGTNLNFTVKDFNCFAIPSFTKKIIPDQIKFFINIITIVDAQAKVNINISSENLPSLSLDNKTCINVNKIYDSVCFQTKITFDKELEKHRCKTIEKITGRIFQLCDGVPKVYFRAVDHTPSALIQIENKSDCIMEAIIELNDERQITEIIEREQQVTIDVCSIKRLLIKCIGNKEAFCRGFYSLCLCRCR